MKCREIFDKINEENKAHQEKLSQKIKESNNNLKDILKKIKVQMEKISTFSDIDDYDDGRSFTETTYSDINANHKYDFQTIHENELNILSNEKKYTLENEKICEEDNNSNENEEVTKEENSNFEKDEETIYHENKNIKKIILNVLNADIKQYLNSKLRSRNIKQEQENKNENQKSKNYDNVINNIENKEIKNQYCENNLKRIKINVNEIKDNNKNNQIDKRNIKIINIEKKRNDNKKLMNKNNNNEIKNIDIYNNNNEPILKNKPIEYIKNNNYENIKNYDTEINDTKNMRPIINNSSFDKNKKKNFEIKNIDIVDSNTINKPILYEIKNFDIQVNKTYEPLIKNSLIENNFEIKNINIEFKNKNNINENDNENELSKLSIKNLDTEVNKIKNNGLENINKQQNNNFTKNKFDIPLNLNPEEKDNKRNYQLEIEHNIPISLKPKQNIITNEVNYFIHSQNDDNITNSSSINKKYDNEKNILKISSNEEFNFSPKNVKNKILKEECINFQPFINKNKAINYEIDSFSICSPIKKKVKNIINFNDGFFIKGHGRRIENVVNLLYFPQKNNQNKNIFTIQKNEIIIEKKEKEDKKKYNEKNNFSVISNNLNLIYNKTNNKNMDVIILNNEKETNNTEIKNNYSIYSNTINFISNNKDINHDKETKNNEIKNNYSINSNAINFINNNKDINHEKETKNNNHENNSINTKNTLINNDDKLVLQNNNNNKDNKKINTFSIENKSKNNIIPENNINVYSLNLLKDYNISKKQIITVKKSKQKKSLHKDNNYIKEKSLKSNSIRNNSYKDKKMLSNKNKSLISNNIQEKSNNNIQKKIKDIFQNEDEIHYEVKNLLKRSRQNTESSTRRNFLIPSSSSQINTNSRTFFNTQVNCISLSTKQNDSLNESINENEENEKSNINENNISIENIDDIYDYKNDDNYYDNYNDDNIDNYNYINNFNDNYNQIINNIHTYKFDSENEKKNNVNERKINYEPPQKIIKIKKKKKSHSINPNKMRNTREEYFNLKNQIELLKKERDFILNHKNESQKKLFSDKRIKPKLKKKNKINLSKSFDNTLEAQKRADQYFEYKLLQDELFKRLELDKKKDDDDNLSQNSLLKSHDSFGEYVDKIIKRSFKLYTNRQCTFCSKLLSQGKSTSLCPKKHHNFKKKN